ncbi:MAG: hypothetical protein HQL88_08205 [Magnetococcales bacterium]|nr:hypothetical protein [Magnetococcales bacterium]
MIRSWPGWMLPGCLLWATLLHGEELPTEWAERQEAALGRLFYTPDQRRLLDRLRLGLPVAAEPAPASAPVPDEGAESREETASTEEANLAAAPPKVITGPRYLSVSGILHKGNNRTVVWLNGQPLEEEEPFKGEGFRAFPNQLDARGLPVQPEDSDHLFYLKSGQTLDVLEKRLYNTYEINPQALHARREPPPSAEKGGEKGQKEPAKGEGAALPKSLKQAADVAKMLREERAKAMDASP